MLLDLLRPVPVEHAGPSRCALLLKLARCFLRADPAHDFSMDPARAVRCCEQVKENDLHGAWRAETTTLKEEAKNLLPQTKPLWEEGDCSHSIPSNEDPHGTPSRSQTFQKMPSAAASSVRRAGGSAGHKRGNDKTIYCLELNSVQTFNMLDTTLTDDLFFAMDAIKEDRMRRT
eukprot:s980_g25.t1